MAENVKGISIEIGLDTTKLKQGLSETEKQLKSEQSALNKINKSMKFELSPLDAWNKKNATLHRMLPLINKEIEEQKAILAGLQKDALGGNATEKSVENAKEKLAELTDQYELVGQQAEYASRQVKKFSEEQRNAKWDALSKLGQSLSAISASIGAVTASIVASETKTASYINQLSDLASASGLAFDEYQKLSYAMGQVGASAETMKSSMAKVNSILGNLATGNGLASAQTLAKLGINYKEFQKLDTKSAFYTLIDALKNVKDETERVGLANSLFGQEMGTKLLPVINAGSDALKEYGEQTSVITDEQAKASKTFENMTTNLKKEFASIGAELLPTMNELLGNFLNLVRDKIAPALKSLADRINALSPSMKNIIAIGSAAVTALGPLLIVIGKMGKSLSGLGSTLSALGSAGGGKIGIIIAAVAALVAILAKAYQTDEGFRESIDGLVSTLKDSLGGVLKTIGSVLNDLKPVFDSIVGVVSTLVKTLIPPLTVVIKVLANAFKTLVEFAEPFISLIANQFASQIDWIKGAFDLMLPMTEAFYGVISSLIDIVQPVLDWMAKFQSKLTGITKAIIGKGSIAEAFKDLGSFITGSFQPICDWLSKSFNTLKDIFFNCAKAVGEFFVNLWNGIKDFFAGIGKKFTDFWESMGNWFTGNGWNTNAELAEQATASSKRMANRQVNETNNNNTTNNNNNDNRTYNVTINTSADSMSFDELDRQLGASLA